MRCCFAILNLVFPPPVRYAMSTEKISTPVDVECAEKETVSWPVRRKAPCSWDYQIVIPRKFWGGGEVAARDELANKSTVAQDKGEDHGASVPHSGLQRSMSTSPEEATMAVELITSSTAFTSSVSERIRPCMDDERPWSCDASSLEALDSSHQSAIPCKSRSRSSTNVEGSNPRKPNNAWSEVEVKRLEELVPLFSYKRGVSVGKRMNGWAKLKQHDELHGNVLKDRTPGDLKDKNRGLERRRGVLR